MSNKVVFACALVAALSLLIQRVAAQDAPPLHPEPWPIYNGFNRQPAQNDLRAFHHQDVAPDKAREIDRFCDQLRSSSEKDSASPGRKPRDPHDRQRAWCTRVNEGRLEGETDMVATIPNDKKISADASFDLALSLEERAEIWRALGQHATKTSIPAGLRVGESLGQGRTYRQLMFSADLTLASALDALGHEEDCQLAARRAKLELQKSSRIGADVSKPASVA
jgi:hypothetical protein